MTLNFHDSKRVYSFQQAAIIEKNNAAYNNK